MITTNLKGSPVSFNLTLYDQVGQKVYGARYLVETGRQLNIHLPRILPYGMYLIKVGQLGKVATRKVMVSSQ